MADDDRDAGSNPNPWREPWPGALDDLKAHIDRNPVAAAALAEFMARFPKLTRDQAIQESWDKGLLPRA